MTVNFVAFVVFFQNLCSQANFLCFLNKININNSLSLFLSINCSSSLFDCVTSLHNWQQSASFYYSVAAAVRCTKNTQGYPTERAPLSSPPLSCTGAMRWFVRGDVAVPPRMCVCVVVCVCVEAEGGRRGREGLEEIHRYYEWRLIKRERALGEWRDGFLRFGLELEKWKSSVFSGGKSKKRIWIIRVGPFNFVSCYC